jgi:maltose alpha-D-glucosyltransferase/alpha-amylase
MAKNIPQWLNDAVFYQIFPASFKDSNADGIGDLRGIIEKLDYVASLGCNAIWLNPCFVSPFQDGGYDVADYYKVAPRYGTNEDMKELFERAHRLGIRVCLDLVPGHTSIEHEWFRRSAESERNEFSHRYIWTDSVWEWDDDNHGPGYSHKPVIGYSQRDGNFFSNYFWFQPAINYGFAKPDPKKKWQLRYDHPDILAVRNEMKSIMRFWLDRGADGFRVDMASSLIKGDKNWRRTSELWRDVRRMFDLEYPAAALIAEWFYPAKAIKAGFHADFMANGKCGEAMAYTALFRKERHRSIVKGWGSSFFDKLGKGDICEFMDVYLKHYRSSRKDGHISLFSGNHDFPRISISRSHKELEVVFAFLLTMPGVPFIYYGDEIGMNHLDVPGKEGGFHRTGARTPMQWDDSENAGFSDAAPQHLYLPVDKLKNRLNVKRQQANKKSLLNTVRKLIELRKSNHCLNGNGDFVPVYAKKRKYPLVYIRRYNGQNILVALNPSADDRQINFPSTFDRAELLMGKGTELNFSNGKCRLGIKGISYGIFNIR